MKRSLITVVMLAVSSIYAEESNEISLFVNTAKSRMWRTSEVSSPTIKWEAPSCAISSTLVISDANEEKSIDVSNLSEYKLNLETPSAANRENVYNLKLTFNCGESNIVKQAQIGVICGMGEDGATVDVRNINKKWNVIKDSRAVIPIPAGAEAMSIDDIQVGNDFDGNAGWYLWKPIKPKAGNALYALSLLFANTEEWNVDVLSIPDGFALIIK